MRKNIPWYLKTMEYLTRSQRFLTMWRDGTVPREERGYPLTTATRGFVAEYNAIVGLGLTTHIQTGEEVGTAYLHYVAWKTGQEVEFLIKPSAMLLFFAFLGYSLAGKK